MTFVRSPLKTVGRLARAGMPLGLALASAGAVSAAPVSYHTATVRGVDVFYREAGPRDAPTLLLLHGFPNSSHMFRDLIPELATRYHVIAPDYPGFGYSGQPAPTRFDYSFAALADVVDALTEQIGAMRYALYMQDFGGPVGFRLAVKHPERFAGLIIQNTTIFAEGWNAETSRPFGPFWKHRSAETEAPIRSFLDADTTKWQFTAGEARPERLSPDAWTHAQSGLDRPGNDTVQLAYLWNYQDNLAQYPVWQNYLGTHQPPVLVAWGKNDPFFTLAGVERLKALVPAAEVHLYDAGHFALESQRSEMLPAIQAFLAKHLQ